jgi:hypothetical protein
MKMNPIKVFRGRRVIARNLGLRTLLRQGKYRKFTGRSGIGWVITHHPTQYAAGTLIRSDNTRTVYEVQTDGSIRRVKK